jgi:hypothetical protein
MGNVELLTLLIPRARIVTHRLNLNDLIVRRFSGETGLGKLAYQFMTTAFAEIANVNTEHEWEIVGAISQLIRLAMLEVAGEQSDLPVREKWRERIKAYIDEHLRDPGLSLDQIAAAMNCDHLEEDAAWLDMALGSRRAAPAEGTLSPLMMQLKYLKAAGSAD